MQYSECRKYGSVSVVSVVSVGSMVVVILVSVESMVVVVSVRIMVVMVKRLLGVW